MSKAIIVENISKAYRLGQIGTGTISLDLERWFARIRGKEDPFLKIGETNDRSRKGSSEVVWSLKNINFEIEEGDAVGIIGRNGAGKSTLLKILSRVTSPTLGKISGKGRIASLLEVGTGFHPELTGRENIFLNGAILGMRKREIQRKFDEIVDFAGVERYIDTPVKRYSSGMYVRLAFAVAAHLESEILIVDEVLAVGDAEFQKKCLGKMGEVSKGQGRTVLFVSHNMGSIQNLCNRGILLDSGALALSGDVQHCISHYITDQTNTASITSIESSKERSGDGSVKFCACYFTDSRNLRLSSLLTGETLTINFRIKVNTPRSKINLGFSIHDAYGDTCTVLYNSYQDFHINVENTGYYLIKCKIDDLPIAKNRIVIKGRIENNGIEADWPKFPLADVMVERGDFFKTGSKGFQGISQLLLKGEWAFEQESIS